MKILRGTIFGGIFYFLLGWLVYGVLLMSYYTSHSNQCLTKPQGEMIWWSMIVSTLLASLFLTLILNWSKAGKMVDGLLKGVVFGALFAAMNDFSFWSMTTMFSSFVPVVIDIVVSGVVFGLTGMVIVLTWGRNKTA
jgi:hypothetical protein